jgi:hypothetical protein
MLLRAELVAEVAFPVSSGDFFQLWLSADHRAVIGSEGRDDYHVNTILFSGKRVAGLGRQVETWPNSAWAVVGATEAPAAKPVQVDPDQHFRLRLHIITSVFPDIGWLRSQIAIRLAEGVGRPTPDVSLRRPDLAIRQGGQGEFIVDITPLIRKT